MIEYLNQKILTTEEEKKQREKGKAIAQAAMSGTFQKSDDEINNEISSSASARNALNKSKSLSKKIVLRKKPVFSHGKHIDVGSKNTIEKKENIKNNKGNNKSEKKHIEKNDTVEDIKDKNKSDKPLIKKVNVKNNKGNNESEKKHIEKNDTVENIKDKNKSDKPLIKKVNVKNNKGNNESEKKHVEKNDRVENIKDKNKSDKSLIKKVNVKNNKGNNKFEKKSTEKNVIKDENSDSKCVIKKVDIKYGEKHDNNSAKSMSNKVSADKTHNKPKINDKKKFNYNGGKKSLNLKDDNKKSHNGDIFADDSLDDDIFDDIDDESLYSDDFTEDNADINFDSKVSIDSKSKLKNVKNEYNDTGVFVKDNNDIKNEDYIDDLDPLAEMRKRSIAKQDIKNISSKPIGNVDKSSKSNSDSINVEKNNDLLDEKDISNSVTVTPSASDRLFDPDDDDMDDLKDVKVDYKSSFDRLAKNSIFDDVDDDLNMESSDEDDYVENVPANNISVENVNSPNVVKQNEKKLIKQNVDVIEKVDKYSLDEKKSIETDLHDLENLTSDLDEIDDDETFWDILEQAGISIGMLKKFTIAVLLLLLVVVFFSFGGVSMFNFTWFNTENEHVITDQIEPITRPKENSISTELLDSSLTTSFIIGTEVFDQVVPMGDFGNSFGVDGALTIGDSNNDFNENEYVKYVNTLREIENLFYTNIYDMLDHSIDRIASLDNYINDVDEVISDAEMNLSLINARMDDYFSREQIENELVTSYENSYIEFISDLKGEAAYSAIDQFVLHEKNVVDLRAKYKAYSKLAEIYNDFLLGIKPRYTDIVLNRDALLKGVHVIDVENSDINAILNR